MESIELAMRQLAVVGLVAFVAWGLYLEMRGELPEGLLWTLMSVFVVADVVLSLLPTADASDPLATKDKLVHVLVNSVLVLLLLFAFVWRPTRGRGRWPHGAAAVLYGVLVFGAVLEALQFLVGRDPSVVDILANAVGGLCGLALWRLLSVGGVGVAFATDARFVAGTSARSSDGRGARGGIRRERAPEPRRAEFQALAHLLTPADGSHTPAVVEADGRWRTAVWPPDADHVVWGRLWLPTTHSVRRALRFAVDRERSLRRLRRRSLKALQPVAVHRIHPPIKAGMGRGGARQALLGGALVELSRVGDVRRVVDVIASAAGARERVTQIRRGSGGTLVALVHRRDGERGVLRVARERSPGDPARAAGALRHARDAGAVEIPSLLAAGRDAGASWTLESFIEGRRPRRVRRDLLEEVGRVLAALPRAPAPPRAPSDDLRTLATFLPEHTQAFAAAAHALDGALGELEGVMRHGDLWSGNLLTHRGRLAGILDWDAWHPSGAPGTDLLYLFVTERWRRTKMPLGELWMERPWVTPAFRRTTEAYWRALGVDTSERVLEAVGIAAWAAQVASGLARLPQLVDNRRWIANNTEKLVFYVARVF